MVELAKRFHPTRQRRHVRLGVAVAERPDRHEYVITNANVQPDTHGHFAGQPVTNSGGLWRVWLTAKQAQFYRDQGVLKLASEHDAQQRLNRDKAHG